MHLRLQPSFDPLPETAIVPVIKGQPLSPLQALVLDKAGLPANEFAGDFKESLPLILREGTRLCRIHLLGMGENPTFAKIQLAFRSFAFRNRLKLPAAFSIEIPAAAPRLWAEASINGILLARHDLGLYKTIKNGNAPFLTGPLEIGLISGTEEAVQAAERGRQIAETQLRVFDLVHLPANYKTPQTMAEWALDSGKKYQYRVEIIQKPQLLEMGMHALLAVNQGSPDPATFIILDYQPQTTPLKTIALVGKGVTFDTGGISIKPSANLHFMKGDMGGAATVMGLVEAAAKLQLPFRIIGLAPATDNLVDAQSFKPGDVIGSYSGKTIEVTDTDAEGRLVLADGLTYAVRHFQPDILLDLATLTGSCIRTFGYTAGGLFSNNDQLAEQLFQAGEVVGERLWRLPIWDEYKEYIKSEIADVRNYSGKPMAGAIAAAKFLEAFIEGHTAWAHLDIAGMATVDSEFAAQKGPTAYGVRLLIQFLESLQHGK